MGPFPDVATRAETNAAIAACIDAGSNIIVHNYKFDAPDQFIEQPLINAAVNDGILYIAGAGNDFNNAENFPASYPNVISVSGITQLQTPIGGLTTNAQVELAAPGGITRSTWIPGNAYGFTAGTGVAASHVAVSSIHYIIQWM